MKDTLLKTYHIAKREFRLLSIEPSAIVIAAIFLMLALYFFFNLLGSFNYTVLQEAQAPVGEIGRTLNLNEWVVQGYFQVLLVLLIFFVPILFSSSIASEKNQGTLALLLTLPISAGQLLSGKLLAASFTITYLISLAVVPAFLLGLISPLEIWPVFIGYFGLVLVGISFSFITVAFSACLGNQILAGIISLVLLFFLYGAHLPAESLNIKDQMFFRYISSMWQLRELFRGVITATPLVYFSSLSVLSYCIAVYMLKIDSVRK
jgi:ABC-2 type transport system permease protein